MIKFIITLIILLLLYNFDNNFRNNNEGKVFDLGMKYIPNYSSNRFIHFFVDILPIILPIILLSGTQHFIKFYYIISYIIITRQIFINLTVFPKNIKCDNINRSQKVFSGHFSTMFLLVLFLYEYKIFTNVYILAISLLIYAISIIMIRSHYTVDLAIAIVVTQLFFQNLKNIKIE